MNILLRQDHRLFNYEENFGSTTTFSPTLLVDAGFLDVQPIGDISCTCYTADKVKSGETGKRYDHTWLWANMVQAGKVVNSGASPQDAFGMAVKGQKIIPTGEIETSAAYFQVEMGQYDFFTNVKSAIQMEYNKGLKRPVGVGTWWYAEWAVGSDGVMPVGITKVSSHEWMICGWDEAHPDCFKIDSHQGFYTYMPREVFNKAMDATYGSVALTLAETTEEKIAYLKETQYSLISHLLDILRNICIGISQKIQALKTVDNKVDNAILPPILDPDLGPVVHPVVPKKEEFPRYQWDTIEHIRKSIRIICDEEGLTLQQKNIACDICACESGYQVRAKLVNSPKSIDKGLFQINNYYHSEVTDEQAYNPEFNTRWAVRYIKQGKAMTFWPASAYCWNKNHKYF